MAVNIDVEPFDADVDNDWANSKYYAVINFFGTEIFRVEIKEDYISEYDLEDMVEVAKQELGALLAPRLAARIVASEWSGIRINKRSDNEG